MKNNLHKKMVYKCVCLFELFYFEFNLGFTGGILFDKAVNLDVFEGKCFDCLHWRVRKELGLATK